MSTSSINEFFIRRFLILEEYLIHTYEVLRLQNKNTKLLM
jgi:hypothetical protein